VRVAQTTSIEPGGDTYLTCTSHSPMQDSSKALEWYMMMAGGTAPAPGTSIVFYLAMHGVRWAGVKAREIPPGQEIRLGDRLDRLDRLDRSVLVQVRVQLKMKLTIITP
jgi:hypothetical protein